MNTVEADPGHAARPVADSDLLLELADAVRDETDPHVVLCKTVEALGRSLGVDAAGCAEVDAAGEYATVSCEWLSGGMTSRIGRWRLLDFGAPEQLARLHAGLQDTITDIREDARLGDARRAHYAGEGVISNLTVPLLSEGRLRFLIFATSSRPREWSEGEITLVREAAARTWGALERVRAAAALKAAEQNQRFLVALGDKLRSLADPMDILLAAAETLGSHLGVNRAGYAEVENGILVIGRDWTDGTVKHGTGRRPLAAWGPDVVAKLERGETERFDDSMTDPRVGPEHRAAFDEMSLVAVLTVPLVKQGRLVGMLSVHQKHARVWTDAEVQLVKEVAERTWAALERSRAELALRASEAQFRMLANNIPALCWMADEEGRPFWFNRRWCEFFGIEEGEAASWDSVSSLDPDQAAQVEARWAQALERREPFEMTLGLKGRHGFRTFLTRVEPMHGPDGRVVRWFGMNTDVTEQIETERTNAFLLALGDRVRRLTDPGEVLRTSTEMLGVHFGATRVGWAEVEADGATIDVAQDWTRGVASVVGRHPLAAFGELHLQAMLAGRTFRIEDAYDSVPRENHPVYEATQIRAAITVPLIKHDQFVALLSVQQDQVRVWTDAEVRLVEEVAERTWSAHEWARAETASRESEQQFRQLANNLPALCWMAEADGRPFWFNRRWCDYFGLSDAEASAADARSGVEIGALPEVEARWAEALARQESFELTLPLRGKDGLLRTFLTRVEPMRGAEGRVVRWFGMNTDITEQMEAERVRTFLLGLEDRLRPLLDPAEVIYAVAEELGRYLEVNRGGYAEVDDGHFVVERPWSNGEVDDAIGRYPINSFDPAVVDSIMRGETFVCDDVEADPRISEAYRGAYSALEMRSIITKPLFKDGELVAIMTVNQRTPRKWTEAEARLVGEVGERAWASVARARAEARLRQSQALLAAFMENAPVGMYLKDADGRYLLANSGMERLLQRSAEQAIGLTASEMFPENMAEIAAQQDALAFQKGRAQVTYRVPISDDPNSGWSLIIRFPIRGEGGDRIGGFVIDIDEQKRAEAELARSREALYQSEKLTALGSLLAGVSHELNNPLAVVVGQSMMLEEEAEGGPFERRALKIRSAAERCARIVQTFLAMARQKPPARTVVDANAVLQGALDLVEYGLRTAGVAVRKDLDPGLPPLSADADQLHQVLANLLVNAQHALQGVNGPREIRVATRRSAEPGRVEIEVSDNGPGVPAELRRRIFEPFFTTKPQGFGTGLGLSFSHGVIEAHGGRLELLDDAGGAAFRISLPAAPAATVESAGAKPAVSPASRGAALVIDDEPEIADMLAELLQRQGFVVSTAESGRAGRAQLEGGRFDVILSDLRMPDMDGPALYDWVVRDRPDLAPKLGFVTGDTLGPAASAFLAKAGRPYLEKPFTPAAVRDFVARLTADASAAVEA